MMKFGREIGLLLCVIAGLEGLSTGGNIALASGPFITVASTSSTQNSGLFDYLLPKFKAATGISVRIIAVGTGAAIRLARAGDADVLLVHHRQSEEKFVAEGFADRRYPLMYNDFLLVGPESDPAGIRGLSDSAAALAKIAAAEAVFVSRGDDSGTHKRERALWAAAGINPSVHSGAWYRETGSGMGATLNTGAAMNAYTLTDRGTWLSFSNKQSLVTSVEGDPRLRNEYGIMPVSEIKHPHVKTALGQSFIDWLRSKEGTATINGYSINGQILFHASP